MRKFFIVFLSFYISSYLIMFSYIGFVELIRRGNNDFGNAWMIIKGVAGLSLLAIIFFSPALLLLSILISLNKNKIFLRYFLSFLLMEIYGFLLFIIWPNSGVFGGEVTMDKIIIYFEISILPTIVFLSFFYFIDNKKYLKVINFLFKKNKQ